MWLLEHSVSQVVCGNMHVIKSTTFSGLGKSRHIILENRVNPEVADSQIYASTSSSIADTLWLINMDKEIITVK